jgi:EmrB/QacA subfamily drug resistance transporter
MTETSASAGDPPVDPTGLDERGVDVGWLPMLFIGLGISMVVMDATIVNVSLPSIIHELHISSIDAEWVNAIYSLVFAAFLIVFGRLGDRLGRRRLFVIGAAVFAVSSILAASTDSGSALIAARALQGVGGAMMSPTSLSLINATYRGKARTVAFAIYGAVIGGMAAVGPLLGGYLTEYHSWRWAFYINVPIAVVLIIGSLRFVPESRATILEPGIDVLGVLLSTVGIAALVFGLIEGRNYGWWISLGNERLLGREWAAGSLSPVPVAFALSAVALVTFVMVEVRRTARGVSALLDLRLFRIRTFSLGSIAVLILSLGELGLLFALPLFLQNVQGYGALGAGVLLATMALGAFLAAPTAATLANARGARFVARLGLALEVLGVVGLGLTISVTTSGWVIAGWLLVYGMGIGYASAQLTGLILADVPVRQSGQASGTQSTARQIGSAMGTAVLGTVLFVSLGANTTSQLQSVPGLSSAQIAAYSHQVEQTAGVVIPSLAARPGGQQVAQAAGVAFAESLQRTAYVAAGFIALGLLATLALPPERRREADAAVRGTSVSAAGE